MAIKTFTTGEVLTASDTNLYLNNGGLVFIAEATASGTTSSVSVLNCFSATYDNYRIEMSNVFTSVSNSVFWRGITGTTPNTSAVYAYTNTGLSTLGATISAAAKDQTSAYLGFDCYNAEANAGAFDFYMPFLQKRTFVAGNTQGLNAGLNGFNFRTAMSMHEGSTTSFDGIQFLCGGGNLTAKIRIYGYRQV